MNFEIFSIIGGLRDVVASKPNNIALKKEEAHTYKKLWNNANEIAEALTNEEISDSPVLVFGKNDYLSLVAMIGTSISGRPYIPVDLHTPLARLGMILEASNPSAVIITNEDTDDDIRALFNEHKVFDLSSFKLETEYDTSKTDISKAPKGGDPYYIIYTSGTTGVPKGVVVSEANLLSFSRWMLSDFLQIDDNHYLSQAPYSFDLSIFSIYPSLLSGGTLVTLGTDETGDFKRLFERLNNEIINTWVSTPSFADVCLVDKSFNEENFPDIRQFIFCGEELTCTTAQKLINAFPSVKVYNTYGPTEATGAVTVQEVTKELLDKVERLPIGKAKAGVEIRIQNPETESFLHSCEKGEIIITGDSVALGYYNNPERTKAAFFNTVHKNAYHTGDVGYLDSDGILWYSGRLDNQIKMNGYRIELQDIEANLTNLPEVEQSIILPKIDKNKKVHYLQAFVKLTNNALTKNERETTKLLKSKLGEVIMDYMIPKKFIYIDEFPINRNGKIDRKQLRLLFEGGSL